MQSYYTFDYFYSIYLTLDIYPYMKTIEDYWKYVAKGAPNDCWPWIRACSVGPSGGYGVLYLGTQHWLAHRLSYTVSIGEIPPDMCVCHTCDNPPCCNPAHLFLGSNYDNVQDRYRKGRNNHVKGIDTGSNVLTEEQVLAIRAEYVPGKVGYKNLGKKYGVHYQTIKEIVTRKTWAWL